MGDADKSTLIEIDGRLTGDYNRLTGDGYIRMKLKIIFDLCFFFFICFQINRGLDLSRVTMTTTTTTSPLDQE